MILKLKNDVCLTCGLRSHHGLSGHVFEQIEYFYYLKFLKGIDAVILIPYDLTPEAFRSCLEKYDFTAEEKQVFIQSTIFEGEVSMLYCRNVIFTDGELEHIPVLGKNIILMRCSGNYAYEKADIVLQDNRLYSEMPNSTHYVKKLLLHRLRYINLCNTDTAMLYGTANCRYLTYDHLLKVKNLFPHERYIVLSNVALEMPDGFELLKVPVSDLFERFSTYIYTALHMKIPADCSPRFPVECHHYGIKMQFECLYPGLKVRLHDIQSNTLDLTEDDPLCNYLI